MVVFPSWLRACAAMILTAGLLALGNGCHGRGSRNTINVNGNVGYNRIPVAYNDQGMPTGLQPVANQVVLPARGVIVRAFQAFNQTDQYGNTYWTWRLAGSTVTDGLGNYFINGVLIVGLPTFLEVESIAPGISARQSTVKVIADPAGIRSSTPEPDRPIYVYRKDIYGYGYSSLAAYQTAISDPMGLNPNNAGLTNVTPATVNALVNFELDNQENPNAGPATYTWAVTSPNWYLPGAGTVPALAPTEIQPVGSRVLAILDSIFTFAAYYGDPTPSTVKGGVLDLHYHPGVTESPRRSYIVYDRRMTPLSFDGTISHYFGTLAGGPVVDDAWDMGVLYPMLARDYLYGQGKTNLFPTGQTGVAGKDPFLLAPDLAVVDGLGDALAATLIQTPTPPNPGNTSFPFGYLAFYATPWLTDTTAATAFTPRDIRAIPSLDTLSTKAFPSPGIYSPASLAAVGWQLSLLVNNYPSGTATPTPYPPQANGVISDSPWNGMNDPTRLSLFYQLLVPTAQSNSLHSGQVFTQTDVNSGYAQLGRLREPQLPGQSADLPSYFTNLTMISLLAPFDITWPGYDVNTGAGAWTPFSADWGVNPVALPAANSTFTLSMAKAQQVPNPAIMIPASQNPPAYVYPNCSQGEVFYGRLAVTLDTAYALSVDAAYVPGATPPAQGYTIEVVVDGDILNPYLFPSGNPGLIQDLTLKGNPFDATNPAVHWVRVRVLSPDVLQPDLAVTLNLNKLS